MMGDLCTASGSAHAMATCIAMCAAKAVLLLLVSLAAARSRLAVLAVDPLHEELAPRHHRFSGVMRGAVRQIAIVVRNAEHLAARATQRAKVECRRFHSAPAPAAAAIGGISCAVG